MSDLAERKYKVSTLEARLSKLPTNKKWERLNDKIKETEKLLQEAIDDGRY